MSMVPTHTRASTPQSVPTHTCACSPHSVPTHTHAHTPQSVPTHTRARTPQSIPLHTCARTPQSVPTQIKTAFNENYISNFKFKDHSRSEASLSRCQFHEHFMSKTYRHFKIKPAHFESTASLHASNGWLYICGCKLWVQNVYEIDNRWRSLLRH